MSNLIPLNLSLKDLKTLNDSLDQTIAAQTKIMARYGIKECKYLEDVARLKLSIIHSIEILEIN